MNIILKHHFNKPDGLADLNLKILDPAAGTLTFIAEAARLALEEYVKKYGKGVKEDFIRNHLLKNFYAFELMMAPYAIGHMKMSYVFEDMGFSLKDEDRFNLYLTNTLEMQDIEQSHLPGMATLSQESYLAGKIKKETPILAILGNPPYSGHSANVGEWISKEIREYYQVDGKPLGERNPKWLQDDYVKFIRFAQWKIDQNGEGVLGFITNHSYLDNPTFRGMRQSLMNSFSEIYILDLHGNTLKKEKCPDGSKDENVFDIRQGVAIALFVKKKENTQDCKVYHSELWGLRDEKYDQLVHNDFKTLKWQKIKPKSEFYLFIPRDERLEESYQKYFQITDIFPLNGVGMTTARDSFVVDMDKNELLKRILLFKNNKGSDDELHQTSNINKKKGWSIRKAWNMLQSISDSEIENLITSVLYRPFDTLWILYHDSLVWRTVKRVMTHMLNENIGLLTCRQQNKVGFVHAFICNNIVESCVVSNKTREINYLFPFYLYSETDKKDLFNQMGKENKKQPNLNPDIFKILNESFINKTITPEQIFYYIYAVLYSNIYRGKYAEFLKIDFPRIPFTKDYDSFIKLGKLGKELADIHLMKSTQLNKTFSRFEVSGDNLVKKVEYVPVGAGLAPALEKKSKTNLATRTGGSME